MAPLMKGSYKKRKRTLLKKACELSILCDIPVCLVCVNPNGTAETYPKEKDRVLDILMAYKKGQNINKPKTIKKNQENEKKIVIAKCEDKKATLVKKVFGTWDSSFDDLSEEGLMSVLENLDTKLQVANRVIGKGKQKIGEKRKIEQVLHTGKKREIEKALLKIGKKEEIRHEGDDTEQGQLELCTRNFIDLVGLCQGSTSDGISDAEGDI